MSAKKKKEKKKKKKEKKLKVPKYKLSFAYRMDRKSLNGSGSVGGI